MGIRALDKQNAEYKAVRCTPAGDLMVSLGTVISGEDQTNDVMVVEVGQFPIHTFTLDGTNAVTLEAAAGAAGDYINYIHMNADAGQAITLTDGSNSMTWTATQAAQGETLPVQAASANGAWTITAGGASTASFTVSGRLS